MLNNTKMETLIKRGRERFYRLQRKLAMGAIAVLLCLAAYFVVFSANGLLDHRQKRNESADLDRQIKSLHQQNSAMEQEIKALKNDPKTIEKEARERLRYAKPGEVIYTVPTVPTAPASEKK